MVAANYVSENAQPSAGLLSESSLDDPLWVEIRYQAKSEADREPSLRERLKALILNESSLEIALANILDDRLGDKRGTIRKQMEEAQPESLFDQSLRADLQAIKYHDPAATNGLVPLLYFKGFLSIQVHRLANWLWISGREMLALHLQSRVSEVFGVDIHPGARIGRGVFIDHATSVVIGETAKVGDAVVLFHEVTLGGTGKLRGDRHPKVGDSVMIGAGAKLLGNIRIGDRAKIGAGSVVVKDVAAGVTVVGPVAGQVANHTAP